MKITKNTTVKFEYVLKDDSGVVLDSTSDDRPADYIHGHGIILPGLENKLEGLEEGAEFSVTIPAEEGYGEISQALFFDVEKSLFPKDVELEIGMEFESGDGGQLVRVKEIQDEKVIVDANHPFAGKTLHFDGKVVEVTETSETELEELEQMMSHSSCSCDSHSCSSCGCGDNGCC